jgi:hypothetical protein
MTYVPDVPLSEPSPAATQVQIQTNFAQFASVFMANHTALNNSNQGDHEGIILQVQANDPNVTQDLVALYCKDVVSQVGTQPQLFAQIKEFLPTSIDTTTAPNAPMQLTYNTVNTAGPQYQSFVVGGLLVFFGSTTGVPITITLSPSPSFLQAAIAIPTNFFHNVIDIPNAANTQITQPNKFKITSFSPAPASTFFWIAIGKA